MYEFSKKRISHIQLYIYIYILSRGFAKFLPKFHRLFQNPTETHEICVKLRKFRCFQPKSRECGVLLRNVVNSVNFSIIQNGDGEFIQHFIGVCASHNENRVRAFDSSRNSPPPLIRLWSGAERVAVLFDNHKKILYNIYRK